MYLSEYLVDAHSQIVHMGLVSTSQILWVIMVAVARMENKNVLFWCKDYCGMTKLMIIVVWLNLGLLWRD